MKLRIKSLKITQRYRYDLVIIMWISSLVRMTSFWNHIHQVRSKSKEWKAKEYIRIWEQTNQRIETVYFNFT